MSHKIMQRPIKPEYYIILVFIIIKLCLHLIADFNSGFQGDEFLHIESGNHRDFGYMEFPPLISWIAYIQNLVGSTSVFVHHIFVHLATILILILGSKIIIELGGGSKAVFFFLLSILVAPAFGRTHQLFQPVVFSQLFWILSYYILIRFLKSKEQNYLIYLSLSLGLGFLAKYDIVFLVAGLVSLLYFKSTRILILSKKSIISIGLFLVIIAPNVWWQVEHDFPIFMHFSELYAAHLNPQNLSALPFDLLISLNPLTAILWFSGFIFMFNKSDKRIYRPIALAVSVSILVLIVARGKFYYFYPFILIGLVFGSIWFERMVTQKRKWLAYLYTFILLLSGLVMVPHGLAILPLETYIKYGGIEKEDNRYKIQFEEYYSDSMWSETIISLRSVYEQLPDDEKENCLIWGKHYKEAGAVNLFRDKFKLPPAFSYHGSFYTWAPQGQMPPSIIAISNRGAGIAFWQQFFEIVETKKRIYNPYADDDEDVWRTIYLCKYPKQSFNELKFSFRSRIFE